MGLDEDGQVWMSLDKLGTLQCIMHKLRQIQISSNQLDHLDHVHPPRHNNPEPADNLNETFTKKTCAIDLDQTTKQMRKWKQYCATGQQFEHVKRKQMLSQGGHKVGNTISNVRKCGTIECTETSAQQTVQQIIKQMKRRM